jgi:hypothetical protein
MKIKQFVAATLVGLSITGAANAQTWSKQSGWAESGEAWGQNDDGTLVFGCGSGEPVAQLMVTLDQHSRFTRLRGGEAYELVFEIDGQPISVPMKYDPSESANFLLRIKADESGFAEDETLNNLVYALQDGSRLKLIMGAYTLTEMSLAGSSEVLRGIYLGCGMRLTGTSPWGGIEN